MGSSSARFFDSAGPRRRVLGYVLALCIGCDAEPMIPITDSRRLTHGWLHRCPVCGNRGVVPLPEADA